MTPRPVALPASWMTRSPGSTGPSPSHPARVRVRIEPTLKLAQAALRRVAGLASESCSSSPAGSKFTPAGPRPGRFHPSARRPGPLGVADSRWNARGRVRRARAGRPAWGHPTAWPASRRMIALSNGNKTREPDSGSGQPPGVQVTRKKVAASGPFHFTLVSRTARSTLRPSERPARPAASEREAGRPPPLTAAAAATAPARPARRGRRPPAGGTRARRPGRARGPGPAGGPPA